MTVLETGWREKLAEELEKPYMRELKEFLTEELKRGAKIYPPREEIFQALKWTPFDQVKVVILGQDPYHGPGQAHGLCFSVRKGVPAPPSLKNIFKELKSDLGISTPEHGCLECWAKQGVLLLNSTLTVREGEPKSHYGRGWEQFTDAIIQKLCERENPIVFLLWGASAQEKAERVFSKQAHPHLVLKAAHPSPFSATRFLGCRHFSETNNWLKEPIDWSVV